MILICLVEEQYNSMDVPLVLSRGQDLLTGGAACYQIYRTADERFVALGAIEDKFWQAFCSTVNRPDWSDLQHEPLPQTELIAAVRELFTSATQKEWQERFAGVDCCLEPILNHSEVVNHPHVQQRQLLQSLPTEQRHDALFPVWVDDQPPSPRRALQKLTAEEALNRWMKP